MMATDARTEELFSLLECGRFRSANFAKQEVINLRNMVCLCFSLFFFFVGCFK